MGVVERNAGSFRNKFKGQVCSLVSGSMKCLYQKRARKTGMRVVEQGRVGGEGVRVRRREDPSSYTYIHLLTVQEDDRRVDLRYLSFVPCVPAVPLGKHSMESSYPFGTLCCVYIFSHGRAILHE